MPHPPQLSLSGKEIVVTGRFASMTHPELRSRIAQQGGRWRREVTGATQIVAVGHDAAAFNSSGGLTRNLARALELRESGLAVVTEDDLLRMLGLEADGDAIRRTYSLLDLARLLKLPGRTLRAWAERGLIQPVEHRDGLPFFDFAQAAAARSICGLLAEGVTPAKLRRGLLQVRACLPELASVAAHLTVLQWTGRLALRSRNGRLMQLNGQLLLDLQAHEADDPLLIYTPCPETVEELFERALALEDQGRFAEAAELYRRASTEDPHDPVLHFNLGNVLYGGQQMEQAADCYRRAVELDASYVEAWNNLGNALAELEQWEESLAAFETALRHAPDYREAHFNLAETHHFLGRQDAARRHWQKCLQAGADDALARSALDRLRAVLKAP
ncbi:MAG: tetratricopeptide repeat protein [Planctomycetes bacterium]|nr:tetratricopeptide repeat protein [Planctomycetota bacterium]